MTPFRIAVIGLPRAGKTTFANMLAKELKANRVNGDDLRVESDDWDFTLEGRVRQARRMREACDKIGGVVVADFVCPTEETRAAFDADITIWMDTVRTSPYPDTDAIFTPPMLAHYTINEWDSAAVHRVADSIRPLLPHGILIGRFQPFHAGHKALVDAILEREHCCVIAIRSVQRNERNPLSQFDVGARIKEALCDPKYSNRIIIRHLPNITGVYYGRDVGYNVDRIELSEELEAIRATDIRKKMQHERIERQPQVLSIAGHQIEFPDEFDAHAMLSIFIEVLKERSRQVTARGSEEDRRWSPLDWKEMIDDYSAMARRAMIIGKADEARRRYIQVAALALAAVQAFDKNRAEALREEVEASQPGGGRRFFKGEQS